MLMKRARACAQADRAELKQVCERGHLRVEVRHGESEEVCCGCARAQADRAELAALDKTDKPTAVTKLGDFLKTV